MVIVDTSFKKLNSLLKKKISLAELEIVLADMGMELDDHEGDEIKVEITAERTDLISPEGLARAINSYKGFVKGYKEIKVEKGNYVHKIDSSVKKYRPYTKSFVVKNVKFTDENIKSLMWIQEKIHETYGRRRKKVAIGVYDLHKITFPVTYCAKKPGEIKFVPLGMKNNLHAKQILSKHPTGRDYAGLLEEFDKYPLQIDAKGQVLSMPPVINSNHSGKIGTDTKDIFVECTGTDEKSLDLIMNIMATMFNDWGGKVCSVKIQDGKSSTTCPNITETKFSVSCECVKNLIGLDSDSKAIAKLLPKMGYNVIEVKKDKLFVNIPSVRTDIWHEVDIADDVARAYGYNNIKPTLPNVSSIGQMLPINVLIEDLSQFLVGLDLMEVKTYALTNHLDQFEKMNVKEFPHIALGQNTEDKNLSMVRCWLMPEVIKALVANRNQEYPQRVFEIGTVIVPDKNVDVKSKNVKKLVCLLCEEQADFTKIRQILDAVGEFLDVNLEVKEAKHGSFIPGRVADVKVKGKKVGVIGEVHPLVLDAWDLKMPIAALELDLSELS